MVLPRVELGLAHWAPLLEAFLAQRGVAHSGLLLVR